MKNKEAIEMIAEMKAKTEAKIEKLQERLEAYSESLDAIEYVVYSYLPSNEGRISRAWLEVVNSQGHYRWAATSLDTPRYSRAKAIKIVRELQKANSEIIVKAVDEVTAVKKDLQHQIDFLSFISVDEEAA